jgi:hypothetical protein
MKRTQQEPAPERVAKGLVRGWLAAKAVRWTVRLTMWLLPFLLAALYGAIAGWRARRAMLAGALDDEAMAGGEQPPSLVVREQGVIGWIRG